MAGLVKPTNPDAPSIFAAITPNDNTRLEGWRFLRIGGAGNLVLKGASPDADTVTLAVSAGEYVPFGAGVVMAATTATSIVGFA